MTAYGWSVAGLVPGREFRITGVDVRADSIAVRYAVRPGIPQDVATGWRALLPRLSLRPPPARAPSVQGGFEPGTSETRGDIGLYDLDLAPGEPVTLVLSSAAGAAVEVLIEVVAPPR